jgi:hypothetical protein
MSKSVNIINSAISTNEDYEQRVSSGLVSNYAVFVGRGYNPDVDTAANEWITPLGLALTLPAAAGVCSLSSASANDALAGTGARIILVEGLDSNYDILQETVNLNGVTPVNTLGSYLRVRRLTVILSGSGQTNAGLITATVGGNTQQLIAAGSAISECLVYTVPNNRTAYLKRYVITCTKPGTDCIMTFTGFNKPFGSNTNIKALYHQIDTSNSSTLTQEIGFSQILTAKSDVTTICTTTVNNTVVNVAAVFLEKIG